MATLYTSTTVSGYNANPPPDDGTTVASNLMTWAGVKSKIGDPLNTFAGSVDGNITTAFGKTLDGAASVGTAINYAMTAADQGRLIVAQAPGITITTPDAATVKFPFAFAVSNQSSGTITIAANSAGGQTIDSQTTQVIKVGSGCIVKTDGANWFTFGLKAAQLTSASPPYGFDVPINLQLNASVNSGILTIAVKTNSGNDPSVSDPVLIPFRDATIANGDPVWIAITSALSINTNAIGATLATQNNVPFRFWICAFNNAGTPVLALWHSGAGAATAAIKPLDESSLQSATGISAAATSAGVFYCPNGTTLTSIAVRKIGFLEYSPGLATAGNYTSAPTKLQLFGPGVSKPGDVVQSGFNSAASSVSVAITPSSAINLIRVAAAGFSVIANSAALLSGAVVLKRGVTTIQSITQTYQGGGSGGNLNWPFAHVQLDSPATAASVTYSFTTSTVNIGQSSLLVEEIMG